MPRRRFVHFAAACAVGLALAAAVEPALAIGYWNVPGNCCQWFGYGSGAGHHAPLVLGTPTVRGWWDRNEVRLPCPPGPPYGWYGGATCNCGYGGPSLMAPSLLPPAGPQLAPSPAAMRPQILR